MTRNRIQKSLILLALGSAFVLGCELIVDFDRTKIPVESTETGPPADATLPDVQTDAPANDAATDASDDASDAGDAASDAPTDAPSDG